MTASALPLTVIPPPVICPAGRTGIGGFIAIIIFMRCVLTCHNCQVSQVHVVPVLFETLVTDVTLLQTGHIWTIANTAVFQRPDYRPQRSNNGW